MAKTGEGKDHSRLGVRRTGGGRKIFKPFGRIWLGGRGEGRATTRKFRQRGVDLVGDSYQLCGFCSHVCGSSC
jgi:hypothetical protein